MNKERRRALIGSLRGGTIIKIAVSGGRWVDFRGNTYTDAEIEEALEFGAVERVPMVKATVNDLQAFINGKAPEEPKPDPATDPKTDKKDTKPNPPSKGKNGKKK